MTKAINKKRGFLGSIDVASQSYWTAGKNSENLRCNETILYAEIDCCQSFAMIAKTQEKIQDQYNKMDMFFLCLKAVEKYSLDQDKLRRAGVVIGNMVKDGEFSKSWATITAENAHVDSLVEEMYKRTEMNAETQENSNFMTWYVDNVIDQNYYNNVDGSKTVDAPRLSGLSAGSNDEWSTKMKESGPYLLYMVTDTSKGLDQKAISRKKQAQTKLLNYLHSSNNNLTKASVLANAKSGIALKTGYEPQEALEEFKREAKEGATNGVGFVITATVVAAIITAVVTILSTIAAIYMQYQTNKTNKEIAELQSSKPSDSDMKQAAPDTSDVEKQAEEAKKAKEELEAEVANMESQSIFTKPLFWIASIFGAGAIGLGVFATTRKKKAQQK